MYGVLQRRVEESGEDRQERLTYSFDKMFARERKTALGKLFEYWHAKRLVSNELPDESLTRVISDRLTFCPNLAEFLRSQSKRMNRTHLNLP